MERLRKTKYKPPERKKKWKQLTRHKKYGEWRSEKRNGLLLIYQRAEPTKEDIELAKRYLAERGWIEENQETTTAKDAE